MKTRIAIVAIIEHPDGIAAEEAKEQAVENFKVVCLPGQSPFVLRAAGSVTESPVADENDLSA